MGDDSRLPQAAEPSCFLAESADGGATRLLLSLGPLEAGAPLAVPFGFDAERLRPQMEAAAAATAAKAAGVADPQGSLLAPGADVVAAAGGGRGRGVFAGRAYAVGELVAAWPCRAVADEDVPPGLRDYVFSAPALGMGLVVLGHGMLYNDGRERANIGWSVPTDAELLLTGEGHVRFLARRDIEPGEELLSSYGDEYWTAKGVTPW